MKHVLLSLILLLPLVSFGQEFSRVSVINITKLNTFRVSIYENEVLKVTAVLPPTAKISIESRDDRKYKVKVTNLTNITEKKVDCLDCTRVPRDRFGRAKVAFDSNFNITLNKPQA